MYTFLDKVSRLCKVSVQGVVALGGHFATLCQELDFYDANFFIINFQKEKALLIILVVKSLQKELHSTNLLLEIDHQNLRLG